MGSLELKLARVDSLLSNLLLLTAVLGDERLYLSFVSMSM